MENASKALIISIIIIIIDRIVFGLICRNIGKSKGLKRTFWLGLFLELIGLITVLCMKSKK